MADGEASGEQRLDDPVESPADAGVDVGDGQVHRFDAFDAANWQFAPAPSPWQRTRPAVLGFVAVGVASLALVVAMVVLARRSGDDDTAPPRTPSTGRTVSTPSTTMTTTTTTTATTTTAGPVDGTTAPPSPLPPAPPPIVGSGDAPRSTTRPAKKPEFNVTRTPMSVGPPQRGASR